MKKIDFGQGISILANLGVIAGIVFLGIELRQNNELMSEGSQQARAQGAGEFWMTIAESDDLAAIWVKDSEGEELDAVEMMRMNGVWMQALWGYQTAFQQLPQEELEAAANLFRRNFRTMKSFRSTWEQNGNSFHPDFVEYMEENVVIER